MNPKTIIIIIIIKIILCFVIIIFVRPFLCLDYVLGV